MTDTLIKKQGIKLLIKGLGRVEAERFISMIIREPFDYTVWQKDLFNEMTGEEICNNAIAYVSSNE